MRHRSMWHPDWPADFVIHIEQPPCRWGDTRWGALRGETCLKDPVVNGMCKSHNVMHQEYEKRGACDVDGCYFVASAVQTVCKTHAVEWAREHALDVALVRSGEIRYPHVPKVHPRDLMPLSKAGAKRRKGLAIELPYKVQHGTRAGYKNGCRCGDCGDVQSKYAREARIKRLSGKAASA